MSTVDKTRYHIDFNGLVAGVNRMLGILPEGNLCSKAPQLPVER